MAIANVVKTIGNSINDKSLNSFSVSTKKDTVIFDNYGYLDINIIKKNENTEWIEQNEFYISEGLSFIVDSINGSDVSDGTTAFKTLDKCIQFIYDNGIFNKIKENKLLIVLKEGEYVLSNVNVFNGISGKSLKIIGQGIKTRILNKFSGRNSYYGKTGFKLYFCKLIWDNKSISTTTVNNLLLYNDIYFQNILFTNINNDSYGWIGGSSGAWFIENCVKDNFSTNFLRDDASGRRSELRNSYGFYTFGYGNPRHTIKENNKIFETDTSLLLDENYRIIDPNVNTDVTGLYCGKWTWEESSTKVFQNNTTTQLKNKILKKNKQNYNLSILNKDIIDIIKDNKNIDKHHLSSVSVPIQIDVDDELWSKEIICKEMMILIENKSHKYKLNPILKLPTLIIAVDGEKEDECGKVEGNIKGFNFIIQKNTYVELSLDFLKDDMIIDSVSGLPQGLIFVNNKIKGTAVKSDEYKIFINLSDGSKIECNLSVPPLVRLL